VVDGVPQVIMISSAIGGDRLSCSVSYCIWVSGPEGWSLVLTEHIGSTDDLHYCLVLFSARARNSLDSKFWRSGDVDMFQQILQSASGDRGFISKSVIPRSEKEGTKPPYVCPGCSNHTYSNNMITRIHVQ
jgi:hypothetical protein